MAFMTPSHQHFWQRASAINQYKGGRILWTAIGKGLAHVRVLLKAIREVVHRWRFPRWVRS